MGRSYGSKRQTLKEKYKIKRRVAEHGRKARRSARAKLRRGGARAKLKKDPGIPNLWPFKEQLLQRMAERDARLAEEGVRRRKERAALHMRNRARKLAELAEKARAAEVAYARASETETALDAEAARAAAQTRRAFMKHVRTVVEGSDVILQVVDARDPQGCRAEDVESMIVAAGKRMIIVVNKVDLVPKEVTKQWLAYLRREYPAIAFKASTKRARSKRARLMDTVGPDALVSMLKQYSLRGGKKMAITVGVIGLPNVGKSSLINSLKHARVVGTSSTPGFTRQTQQVSLDAKVKLLDCPGIIFNASSSDAASLVLRNAMKVEDIVDPVAAVAALVDRCGRPQLCALYRVPYFDHVDQFVQSVGQRRGVVAGGGVVRTEATAELILREFNAGRIPYYATPPEVADHRGATRYVEEWGPEFNLEAAYAADDSVLVAGVSEEESEAASFLPFASSAPGASLLAAGGGGGGGGGAGSAGMDIEGEEGEGFADGDGDGDYDDPAVSAAAAAAAKKSVERMEVEERLAALDAKAAEAAEAARHAAAGLSLLDDDEAELNRQPAKAAARAAKNARKRARRAIRKEEQAAAAAAAAERASIGGDDADYDFDML
eukprot:PLAT10642.1.p1 GENE.PLAT10642.1~~PLAT10642.1.p1  ORF type:complete len:632 (-),score=331.69 PLAT10642.1:56-1876(-)